MKTAIILGRVLIYCLVEFILKRNCFYFQTSEYRFEWMTFFSWTYKEFKSTEYGKKTCI